MTMIPEQSEYKMLRSIAYSRTWHGQATAKQVRLVNIFLSYYCETRAEKLWLLEQWFNREFPSSKELTKSEACAILDMAYTENTWEHTLPFINFIKFCLGEYYQF